MIDHLQYGNSGMSTKVEKRTPWGKLRLSMLIGMSETSQVRGHGGLLIVLYHNMELQLLFVYEP